MAGTLQFADSTTVHVAVFVELIVSVAVNDLNSLRASILPIIVKTPK